MNVDKFTEIAKLVISVIVTMNTFSKLEKNTKLSDDYFEKVLRIYAKEYKNNPKIESLNFIKQKFDISNYFVPSYVFYLVDKGESEKLHKILINDYIQKLPSKENSIFNGIYDIVILFLSVLVFVYCLLTIVFSIIGGFSFSSLIFDIVSSKNIDIKNIRLIGSSIFMCAILIIFICLEKKCILDEYTMKNENIKEIIKRKERNFNRLNKNDKYYIT